MKPKRVCVVHLSLSNYGRTGYDPNCRVHVVSRVGLRV